VRLLQQNMEIGKYKMKTKERSLKNPGAAPLGVSTAGRNEVNLTGAALAEVYTPGTQSSSRVFTDTFPVMVTTSPLTRGADASVADHDEKAIRGLIAAFGNALTDLDARAFSMVFHHGADFTNVWGVTAHGRQAIQEFHRPLLEGDGAGAIPSFKNAEFKILETRIRFLRPDVASVDATWSQTGAVQHGQELGRRKGLLMLILTRELNAWGIAGMHNMDLTTGK
jgi:uncharacterized protein (TIGR02246 family)